MFVVFYRVLLFTVLTLDFRRQPLMLYKLFKTFRVIDLFKFLILHLHIMDTCSSSNICMAKSYFQRFLLFQEGLFAQSNSGRGKFRSPNVINYSKSMEQSVRS